VLAETGDADAALTASLGASHAVYDRAAIDFQKQADLAAKTATAQQQVARAFGQGESAGLRAEAGVEALITTYTKYGDVAGRTGEIEALRSQILVKGATEAALAAAKTLPGLTQQTEASTRLAEATKLGAGAAHDAAIENQVVAASHDLLKRAEAAGIDVQKSGIAVLRERIATQIRDNDAALQAKAIRDRINERGDQIAVVQLQTAMVGQTPESIAAATAHLQEQQRLLAQGVDLNSDIAKASLANVDALSRANAQLAAATRESARWDDAIRGIASSVENTLTRAIEDSFSGKRVTDWGTRIKSMLASLVSTISDALFIKPLLGQPLGFVGFGSFGELGEKE
jgi:hypothetical protein